MTRVSSRSLIGILAGTVVSSALATPPINSAVLHTRIFNDFPNSTLSTTNLYPGVVEFLDGPVGPGTFANRHNFRLSTDGTTDAAFMNNDGFVFEADVALLGTGPVEGGLQVSPWWSSHVDGQFNMRLNDGEVAVFGGRLPFYSFTGSQGVHYLAGTTVHQKMIYRPNGLSSTSPATIEYIYTDSTGLYSSGPLSFDEGNPSEPYGTWGMLDFAAVGGMVQVMNFDGNQHTAGIRFENMTFVPAPSTLALVGLVGLAAGRRRR